MIGVEERKLTGFITIYVAGREKTEEEMEFGEFQVNVRNVRQRSGSLW